MNSTYRNRLNELIAEHIIGATPGVDFGVAPEHKWATDTTGEIQLCSPLYGNTYSPCCTRCRKFYPTTTPNELCVVKAFDYLARPRDALLIIKRMRGFGYVFTLSGSENSHTCNFLKREASGSATAKSMKIAVVLAALRALGVNIPKEEDA